MTLKDLFLYLTFQRSAIDRIAACPSALWLGLCLVLLAAVARDYDGIDLQAEPWHLLIPAGASLVTATTLFAWLRLFQCEGLRKLRYRTFLSLFWLTAPMAWLYAIPVERFLTAAQATEANLWLLAIVSLWRVLLITRVVSHLTAQPHSAAFCRVMLFADTIVLIILRNTPLPMLNIMGGIRLQDRDRVLQNAALLTGLLSVVLWPILAAANLSFVVRRWPKLNTDSASKDAPPEDLSPAESSRAESFLPAVPVHVSAWLFVAALTAAGAALLSIAQPEQRLRYAAEKLLTSGRVAEGLRMMSAHRPDEFPPLWVPPPAVGWQHMKPHPAESAFLSLQPDIADWVRTIMLTHFTNYFGTTDYAFHQWQDLSIEELTFTLEVLKHNDLLDEEFTRTALDKLKWAYEDDPNPDRRNLATEFLNQTSPGRAENASPAVTLALFPQSQMLAAVGTRASVYITVFG
ncbi:MAG: hypothetical protein R3C49_27740 [Planctomycetaceae bacterium]